MFYGNATEWVPGFKPFIAGKLLCALEQAVSVFVSVPEQTLLFFCILTVLSLQIVVVQSLPSLEMQKIILERELEYFGEKNSLWNGDTMWKSTCHQDLS